MENNLELYHYGVLGMKWGVRRARRLYKKGTEESRVKSRKLLDKHEGKINKKLTSLNNERAGLEKKRQKQILKADPKAAKLALKSIKNRKKARRRFFMSEERAQKLIYKSESLMIRSEKIRSISESTKAQIEKNQRLQDLFKMGFDEIQEIRRKSS